MCMLNFHAFLVVRSAIVFDVETGDNLNTFAGHDDELTFVSVCRPQKLFVTCSKDATFRLWDLREPNLQSVSVFQGHSESVNCAQFTPNGDTIVSGGDDKVRSAGVSAEHACVPSIFSMSEIPRNPTKFHGIPQKPMEFHGIRGSICAICTSGVSLNQTIKLRLPCPNETIFSLDWVEVLKIDSEPFPFFSFFLLSVFPLEDFQHFEYYTGKFRGYFWSILIYWLSLTGGMCRCFLLVWNGYFRNPFSFGFILNVLMKFSLLFDRKCLLFQVLRVWDMRQMREPKASVRMDGKEWKGQTSIQCYWTNVLLNGKMSWIFQEESTGYQYRNPSRWPSLWTIAAWASTPFSRGNSLAYPEPNETAISGWCPVGNDNFMFFP